MEKALEALHVAANAIRTMQGIDMVSVENDNDSGEIFFVVDGDQFLMKLKPFNPMED